MEFWGYRRPDGKVGVRNKILILPASICATDTARIVASQVEGAVTFHGGDLAGLRGLSDGVGGQGDQKAHQ